MDAATERVLELWRLGARREDISRQAGVTFAAIREIVAAHATPADAVARREACLARRAVDVAPRFSDRELQDGVLLVNEWLGHVPSGPEYQRLAAQHGLACLATVCARFGSFGRALEATGLAHRPVRVRARRWNEAACWRAVVSVADQLGDPPRYRRYLELAAQREDLPSGATVRLRLGLWPQITAALQTQPRSATSVLPERLAA